MFLTSMPNCSKKDWYSINLLEGWKAGLTLVVPTWFTCPQTVTHPKSNRPRCRLTTPSPSCAIYVKKIDLIPRCNRPSYPVLELSLAKCRQNEIS